jgi:hypothetical protein
MRIIKYSKTTTIVVVTKNIESFRKWLVENERIYEHKPSLIRKNTIRDYIYKNNRYVCITHPNHCRGIRAHKIIDLFDAHDNKYYNEIHYILEPAMVMKKTIILMLLNFISKYMKNKYVLFALIPLVSLIELQWFSYMAELARQPSDIAVLVGIVLLCLLLAGNYFLIKILISKFKTK